MVHNSSSSRIAKSFKDACMLSTIVGLLAEGKKKVYPQCSFDPTATLFFHQK